MLQSYVTVIDEATVNAQYCRRCGKTFEKQRIVKWLLMRSKWRILFGPHMRKAWDWALNGPLTTVSLLFAWDRENSQSSINFGCGRISTYFWKFYCKCLWARLGQKYNMDGLKSLLQVINLWGQPRQLLMMKLWVDGFEFGRKEGCKLQPQNTLSLIHTQIQPHGSADDAFHHHNQGSIWITTSRRAPPIIETQFQKHFYKEMKKTSQELRMLSLSLFIQGSLWMLRLLFSIVRNVISVTKATSL